MFNDKTESFKTALTHDPDIKDDFEMEDDASLAYHFMIMKREVFFQIVRRLTYNIPLLNFDHAIRH